MGIGSLGYEIWAHTGDRASYPPTPITDPQADIDHDAYKEELSPPLPPTNDTCHYLELKLERQKKLLADRQKWDATHWNVATMGPSPHEGAIAETENAIAKLENKIYQCKKQKCR